MNEEFEYKINNAKIKALETLEDENQRIVGKKWKSAKGKMELEAFLGLYK